MNVLCASSDGENFVTSVKWNETGERLAVGTKYGNIQVRLQQNAKYTVQFFFLYVLKRR